MQPKGVTSGSGRCFSRERFLDPAMLLDPSVVTDRSHLAEEGTGTEPRANGLTSTVR